MSQEPESHKDTALEVESSISDVQDDVWNLIADLRHWLEWQAECGAEDWCVDDWRAWINPVARISPQRQRPVKAVRRGEEEDEPVKAPAPKPSPRTEIPSLWQSIIDNASPNLNIENLPTGEAGFRQVRAFQEQNCSKSERCRIGVGNILAPVLIIAGDKMSMQPDGFKMLTNMRANVLKLDKTQLYFMEYPMQGNSCCCLQIFNGLLQAKAPKFILIMGEECAFNLLQEGSRPLMGELGEFRFGMRGGQPIPVMWTHHPHYLIENGHEKRTVMRHLQNMKRFLRKLNIG